ncbi:IS3 family transposase [Bacillus halotolerans]|nr:IS3 family transposase [Bacillus halotolerans]
MSPHFHLRPINLIIFQYIYYYNNIRIQTKLNSQSPINYRQLAV